MSEHNFHIHAYAGRENGLMIIGEREALRKLGKELLEPAVEEESTAEDEWPKQVAILNSASPYADRPDYQVSIHLQTAALPASLLKKARSGTSTAIFLGICFLSLVGAVSLPVWLWKAF
jgi:hypothetical protein